VSAILVALLAAWLFSTNVFGIPLPMTAPMAVLILPALGLALDDPFYRRKCIQIALLGVALGRGRAIDSGNPYAAGDDRRSYAARRDRPAVVGDRVG